MKLSFPFIIILSFFILFSAEIHAQKDVTIFGFVVKPIFPSKYFRTGPIGFSNKGVDFILTQKSGFSAGGVLRKGLTKSLSLETGINYVKRIYDLEIKDSTFSGKSDFKIVGYEIPLQAMVFVQLSQTIWMNAALGPSIDMYPSDILTFADYYRNVTERNSHLSVFNGGLIANLGWEWRTRKNGYLYFGACYHRSFNDIYTSTIGYKRDPNFNSYYSQGSTGLSGDYLTFDVRYYFYEDPRQKIIIKK